MNDQPTELEQAVRDWEVAGAPPGFADRVLDAADHEHAAPDAEAPKRRVATLGIAAMAVAAAALLIVWLWRPSPITGELTATERATISLPSAVAVVEPGGRLQWSGDADTVRVRQHSGRVFYRVDDGADFTVATDAGEVRVRGTAFEIEVDTMSRNKHITSGLAGGAIAVVAIVTLYEGQVVVASNGTTAALEPGQQARLSSDAPPRVEDRETEAALRAEIGALRSDLETARQRRLGAPDGPPTGAVPTPTPGAEAAAAPTGGASVARCALSFGGDGCSLLDPSQQVLDYRAQCGVVAYDRPRAVESANIDFSEAAELAGLDVDEVATLEDSSRKFHEHVRTELESIYRELGGDETLASKLSTSALSSQIDELTEAESEHYAYYDEAAELQSSVLAGHREAPRLEELSPAERHAYLMTAAGELYEDWLAEALGPTLARELREAEGGWTGNRGIQGTPHCPESP